MSATPIFEQLCRDFHDAGKTQPVAAPQPPAVSQPKAPAHSLEYTRRGRLHHRDDDLPRALAEWACPAG
jgi:hypothetical protein